jgi:hypothetical protein
LLIRFGALPSERRFDEGQGSAMGVLNHLHLAPFRMSNLVLFAFYCVFIGTLIVRSSFMPRFVGVLMMIAAPD